MDNDYPIETYPTITQGQKLTYTPISVLIESLIITEGGSYNEQVIRPHTSTPNGDALNSFVNNIQSVMSKQCKITPVLLGSSIGNIITPSTAAESSIPIPNGWSTRRLRFILKVRMNSPMSNPRLGYFQGYTEYSDPSMSGQLDPNMQFFINSYVIVEESTVNTPNGVFMMPRLIESSNILPPSGNIPGPFQSPNPYMEPSRHLTYMRPNDVFSSIQVSHLREKLNGSVYDHRADVNTYVKSWKSNNNVGSYMSGILNNYIQNSIANRVSNNGQGYDGESTILEQSFNPAEDTSLTDNPFFRELAKAHGASFRAVTNFSLKTLIDIDKDLQHKIRYVRPTSTMLANVPQAGNSEYWTGQTREVVSATLIMNSLSSIMFETMISNVSLVSTNMTFDNQMQTTVTSALSLTGVDATPYLQALIIRLEKEILSTITFNNQDPYKVIIDMDLFGFTNIQISLSGGPMVPFTAPTFADSLFSPVTTFNPMIKNQLVNDMEYTLDAISSSIPISTQYISSDNTKIYNF
jgi:hypothetical protein